MDEKVIVTLFSAGGVLFGSLIAAGVAIYTNHQIAVRETRKDHLSRVGSLAMDRLGPTVYEPLLRILRAGELRISYGEQPNWPRMDILDILQSQRFLILLAPTPIQEELRRMEQQIEHPKLQGDALQQRLREDLQRLEAAIFSEYEFYRLGESNAGKR